MMHSTILFMVIWRQEPVEDHLYGETGNLLPAQHDLLFLICSKGSFICTIPQTEHHTAFVSYGALAGTPALIYIYIYTYIIKVFKMQTSSSVDSCWTESFPDNRFADVGSNEQRNTRSKTIAFLEQLIQQQNNQTCYKKLK